MKWPSNWFPIEQNDQQVALAAELRKELKSGHPLNGLQCNFIGCRHDSDDYLVQIKDGTGRVAEIHLTFAGEREEPPCPYTTLFDSFDAWVESAEGSP